MRLLRQSHLSFPSLTWILLYEAVEDVECCGIVADTRGAGDTVAGCVSASAGVDSTDGDSTDGDSTDGDGTVGDCTAGGEGEVC